MSYKLYANDRCVQEILDEFDAKQTELLKKLVELELSDIPSKETKLKACNCPNCGAPITSYICEYCGTILDKDKYDKSLEDHKEQERIEQQFQNLMSSFQSANMYAAQEYQQQHLLNMLNAYHPEVQIMNLQDNIDYSMLRSRWYDDLLPIIKPKDNDIKDAETFVRGVNLLLLAVLIFLAIIFAVIVYHYAL